MRKLLIATRSAGKLPEIVSELAGLEFDCIGLNQINDLPADFEVEEPAMSFEGNAIIKAMALGQKTGLLTLAEDSGLCVDALDGRPGVYSKRYAQGSDEDRYLKLLDELRGVDMADRTARFVTVVAIFDPVNGRVRTCQGVVEGRIGVEPVGENGFGYDPIFYSIELGKTNAEMTLAEKNEVSHRGKALRLAKQLLTSEF